MKETRTTAFALLRYALCGAEIPQSVKETLAEEGLEKVYQLLKMHDLAHLAYDGLRSFAADGALAQTEAYGLFKRQQQLAVYRYEQKLYEYEQICKTLEEAEIEYLPLKGAVLKAYYPQEWMRTSCDIDILVRADKLGRATEALQTKLHYKLEGNHSHEVSLFAENGVHLELHYDLIEDYLPPISAGVLSAYWNTAQPVAAGSYRYEAADEQFYFYHIAHMAKHFEMGGCGIRSFMDLWLWLEKTGVDEAKYAEILKKGDLTTFAANVNKLARVWFSDGEHDGLTVRMEAYVLGGGVYGSMENHIAVENTKRKQGKFRYVMRRIFMPYEYLKWQYPILQKHKWLTPFYEVRRWGRLIFKGKWKKSVREMRSVNALENAKREEVAVLLKDLGL